MKSDENSEFIGIGEAARIMSLSRSSIQKLVDSGEVAAIKTVGGHRRILRTSLPNLRFEVTKTQAQLPQSNSRYRMALNGNSKSSAPRDILVLIADDDLTQVNLIKGAFESELPGMQCIEASKGLDVILKLERLRPDIFMINLSTPQLDGFDLITQVCARNEFPEMVIVAISSLSAAELQKRGGLPANVLLLKTPLNMDRLKGFAEAHLQLQRRGARAPSPAPH